MHRRTFLGAIPPAVLSYALLDSLFRTQAFGRPVRPIAGHWAKRLHTMCQDLRLEKISQQLWQEEVEGLFNQVDLPELLSFIDFDRLLKGFTYPDLGVHTRPALFPKLDGLPEKTVFVKKIFGMKKDRAIIPHGHSNMASAHLVLKGEFALKHYEKVGEEARHLLVRPTVDRTAGVGACSSISDERDNIHWFIARSETAFTFDVIMLDLGGKPYDIHNIDLEAAESLGNGLLRAEKMEVEAALKKYGKRHH